MWIKITNSVAVEQYFFNIHSEMITLSLGLIVIHVITWYAQGNLN